MFLRENYSFIPLGFCFVLYISISLQYSFHSYRINKHQIKLHLLTDMNCDYMFRLKLAAVM